MGAVFSLAACGFERAPASAPCIEGQQTSCLCAGQPSGHRACAADGSFGACLCGPQNGSASGGGTGLAGQPGTPSAGAGGVGAGAGNLAGAGAGANDSTAGAAAEAGSSAAGTGGFGGTASAGSGGEGGSSAGAAGGGGSGSAAAPVLPAPGSTYAFCLSDGECNEGLACATSMSDGGSTGYCTSPCGRDESSGSGSGDRSSCVQPQTGTVGASCVQFAGVCLLDSCEYADCPDGMDCVQTPFVTPWGSGVAHGCAYPPR